MVREKGSAKMEPLAYAMHFISYRPRSCQEVADALKKRGVDENSREEIIAKLEGMGLLDDRVFAESWIHYRTGALPKGRFGVIRELREKGLTQEVIEEVMAQYYPRELEISLLSGILEKEGVRLLTEPPDKRERALQKLINKLQYKGFSQWVILEGIRRLESIFKEANLRESHSLSFKDE